MQAELSFIDLFLGASLVVQVSDDYFVCFGWNFLVVYF